MGRLKGISPLLSPDLLHTLASMGHGDELGILIYYAPSLFTWQKFVRK